MNSLSNVGALILKHIHLNNTTQKELSIRTSIHRSNLSEIVRGTRPLTIEFAKAIEWNLPGFSAREALIIQLDQKLNLIQSAHVNTPQR